MGLGSAIGGAVNNAANAGSNAAHDAGNAANDAAHHAADAAHDAANQAGGAAQNAAQQTNNAVQGTAQQLVAACGGDPVRLADALATVEQVFHEAVFQLAQQRFGNGFVQQVLAAMQRTQQLKHQLVDKVSTIAGKCADGAVQAALAQLETRLNQCASSDVLQMAKVTLAVLEAVVLTIAESQTGPVIAIIQVICTCVAVGNAVGIEIAKHDLEMLLRAHHGAKKQLGKVDHGVKGVMTEIKHAKSHEDDEKKRAEDGGETKERVMDNANKAAGSLADVHKAILGLGK